MTYTITDISHISRIGPRFELTVYRANGRSVSYYSSREAAEAYAATYVKY